MKTTLPWVFTLSLIIANFSPACGQTTFVFANSFPYNATTPLLDAPVYDSNGNRLSGNDYVAMLYGGPDVNSLTPAISGTIPMTPVGFTYIPPNGLAGYFFQPSFVEIDTVRCCGTDLPWLQVRVWDARLGSSYDAVAALGIGGYGESTLFQARGGDPLSITPPQPLIGLQSFNLRAEVPEPGGVMLLIVGLAGLGFGRRFSLRRKAYSCRSSQSR
jgi:hypothetical protein